jgi:hypothetical protein
MGSLLVHSLHQVRSTRAPVRAIVHLTATLHGGFASITLPASSRNLLDEASRTLCFPYLTSQAVGKWLLRRNDAGQVVGGFQFALDNSGIWLLEEWVRREKSREQKLTLPLRGVAGALPEAMNTLRQAVCWMVESWRAEADILSGRGCQQQELARRLRERLALPLGMALVQGTLEEELGRFLHEAESEVLLPQLSDVVMVPLRQQLNELQVNDPTQHILFIPHGQLGWLPLQDALVSDPHTGQKVPFQTTCKLTYSSGCFPSNTL